MRIPQLLEIEDYRSIFKDSLAAFLNDYAGWQGKIEWGEDSRQAGLVFYENQQLNLLYPRTIDRNRLAEVTRDYRTNPRLFRHIKRNAYASLAVRWPLERYTTSAALILTPPPILADWVFIPGNSFIRAIDFRRDVSIVFRKQGYDISNVLNDAKVRQQFPFLQSPVVHSLNTEKGWYEEERIVCIPLSRMANGADKKARVQELITNLCALYAQTRQEVALDSYITTLRTDLETLLVRAETRHAPDIVAQIRTLIACETARLSRYRNATITLVQSHGDLSLDNMVTDGTRNLIIDWEYTGYRSALYDYFYFFIHPFGKNGLAERLIAARKAKGPGECEWPLDYQEDMDIAVSLYSLEFLAFRLKVAVFQTHPLPGGSWLSEMIASAQAD